MNNNRGQALVEFVLILPIFIFILLTVFDIGMIFNKKNILESSSSDIIELYSTGTTLDEIKELYNDLSVEIMYEDNYKQIIISEDIKLITPGLNKVFGDPYTVSVKRYIANE